MEDLEFSEYEYHDDDSLGDNLKPLCEAKVEESKLHEKSNKRLSFKAKYGIFLIIISMIFGGVSYEYAKSDIYIESLNLLKKKNYSNFIRFNVPYGAGTRQIANNLYDAGVIKSTFVFRVISKAYGYDGRYQAGMHLVTSQYSYPQIMNALTSKSLSVRLTIPEGYSYRQILDLLISNGIVNEQEFVQAMNEEGFDYSFLDNARTRDIWLEGYLFPDTYEFMQTETPKEIIDKFLKNFDKKFEDSYYVRAKRMGMTVDEVITLASIVEKEAKLPQDRKKIAGVFYNRLNSKEPYLRKLQSCATVQYILFNRYGITKEVLTSKDTSIDSPYNTYLIEGLPQGPICCPGKASIEAVLYPENNDYYYFVAKKDGGHVFSKTYEQHMEAVKRVN